MGPDQAQGRSAAPSRLDYALVGGGLQNGLLALALAHLQPDARVAIVERAERLGGNHTWCFHATDVAPEAEAWIAPLVAHAWEGYEVRFPAFVREVGLAYRAITSERLDAVVQRAVLARGGSILTGAEAVDVRADEVVLADGRVLRARLVVDARGLGREAEVRGVGWQKFLGLEVRTARPHGLLHPVLMDARLGQEDGFRFMYVLPFGPDRALVEDTRFSDTAVLDRVEARGAVEAWLAAAGWEVAEVLREEAGVLPMPWQAVAPRPECDGVVLGGMRGGWFHPATGYSLAAAVRLAQWIAARAPEAVPGAPLAAFARDHVRRARFARRLNQALFRLADPSNRVHMLSRFYRRPDAVIGRFYAMRSTLLDKVRVVAGAPPAGMRFWPRRVASRLTMPQEVAR